MTKEAIPICGRLKLDDVRLVLHAVGYDAGPIKVRPSLGADFKAQGWPGQTVPGLTRHPEGLQAGGYSWGIANYHNARIETAERRGSAWNGLYQTNRALVPVTGFWEGLKCFEAERYFLLAAIVQGDQISVLTTAATGEVARYHHRMPIVIETKYVYRWLDNLSFLRENTEPCIT